MESCTLTYSVPHEQRGYVDTRVAQFFTDNPRIYAHEEPHFYGAVVTRVVIIQIEIRPNCDTQMILNVLRYISSQLTKFRYKLEMHRIGEPYPSIIYLNKRGKEIHVKRRTKMSTIAVA